MSSSQSSNPKEEGLYFNLKKKLTQLNSEYDIFLYSTFLLSIGLASRDISTTIDSSNISSVDMNYRSWLWAEGLSTLGLAFFSLLFLFLYKIPSCTKVFIVIKIILIFLKVIWLSIGMSIFFSLNRNQLSVPLFIFSLVYFMAFMFLIFRLIDGICGIIGQKIEQAYDNHEEKPQKYKIMETENRINGQPMQIRVFGVQKDDKRSDNNKTGQYPRQQEQKGGLRPEPIKQSRVRKNSDINIQHPQDQIKVSHVNPTFKISHQNNMGISSNITQLNVNDSKGFIVSQQNNMGTQRSGTMEEKVSEDRPQRFALKLGVPSTIPQQTEYSNSEILKADSSRPIRNSQQSQSLPIPAKQNLQEVRRTTSAQITKIPKN